MLGKLIQNSQIKHILNFNPKKYETKLIYKRNDKHKTVEICVMGGGDLVGDDGSSYVFCENGKFKWKYLISEESIYWKNIL